jgi:hypothetical protein
MQQATLAFRSKASLLACWVCRIQQSDTSQQRQVLMKQIKHTHWQYSKKNDQILEVVRNDGVLNASTNLQRPPPLAVCRHYCTYLWY